MFQHTNYTVHASQDGSGLSGNLWADVLEPGLAPAGGNGGIFEGDDFNRFQGFTNAISGVTGLPSTTVPGVDGYQIYVDSATTASGVSRLADVVGGVARFSPGATDNHLAILGTNDLGRISDGSGEKKRVMFEARVRFPTQVTDGSVFIGLASPGAIVDGGLIANDGALKADQGGIGFRIKEDDPDGLDIVYQAASQTEQVVLNEAQVVSADTWYKVGFKYDPFNAVASERIKFFIDNVEKGSYVTDTNIAAATFPDGDFLGVFLAAMTEGTTARLMDVDWWAYYQDR